MSGEQSLAGDSSSGPSRCNLPRFTLRGLFVFLTATAVCLSVGATAAQMKGIDELFLRGLQVLPFWTVMLVTYRRLRLRAAFWIHLVVPGVFGGLWLVCMEMYVGAGAMLDPTALTPSDVTQFTLMLCAVAVVMGCLLALLLSLLVAAATWLVAAVTAGRIRSG